MKALIPMAGEGSRFQAAGYTFPKPLVDVAGKPMISLVIENLPECDEYIFLCKREHLDQYDLYSMLENITGGKSRIVVVNELTEGAACTALLAKQYIDNNEPLIIANSDQYIEYNLKNFSIMRSCMYDIDGIIFTFNASHPKWSFVRLDEDDEYITEVAEKSPISNIATCGIYFFKRGSDFVLAAKEMIRKDLRTNGEFYLAPVFNEMIKHDDAILPFYVDRMYGLGTPEDLEAFLQKR